MSDRKLHTKHKYTKTTIQKEQWTNGDLNPGPFTIAHMRSENHTPRPFARCLSYKSLLLNLYQSFEMMISAMYHSHQ